VLRSYLPVNSDNGNAAQALCEQLGGAINSADAAQQRAAANAVEMSPSHPMRAMPLSLALHSSILTPSAVSQVGTYWGSQVSGEAGASSFELSHDVERCGNFISHNWRDDGFRKVKHLGFILMFGHLCMSAFVVALVLFAFLLAFEIALSSALDIPMSWVMPLLPFALLMSVLLWVGLSLMNALPAPHTPAGVAERLGGGMTVWIDKTCVDQSNVPGFIAQGIDSFMFKCDRVIAFISPGCERIAIQANPLRVTAKCIPHTRCIACPQTLSARGASLS